MTARVDAAIGRYRALAQAVAAGEARRCPDGVPVQEYTRSPAAARVAAMAAASGLFCFHFEQRAHLELPEAWVPAHTPSLADPPGWENGILPEAKYQSFRHDLLIGSFHPHHRAKWSTHELCHGLVGFAWRPGATPFFHATAGRLAELLPVALWYFFDEVLQRRCPDHAVAGPLFRQGCARCEEIAVADPSGTVDALADGLAFVDRELAAIARSRRLGRPVPHVWATIDLCSDGIAYARAHHRRLDSPAFRLFAEHALRDTGSPDLDALEARVLAVLAGLLGEGEPAPWAPSPAHGRARWTLQDLAFRLATVWADTEGEVADEIARMLGVLGGAVDATSAMADPIPAFEQAMHEVRRAWEALEEEVVVPAAVDVFALGYPGPALERGGHLLRAGLDTCTPLTLTLLGARADAVVDRFAAEAPWRRGHVAARFADWLAGVLPGPAADLARWEAAAGTLPDAPVDVLPGPGAGLTVARHARILTFDRDVLALAERVDSGVTEGRWDGATLSLHQHDGGAVEEAPTALALVRDELGEIVLLDLDPATGAALMASKEPPWDGVDDDEVAALVEAGVLVPTRWQA